MDAIESGFDVLASIEKTLRSFKRKCVGITGLSFQQSVLQMSNSISVKSAAVNCPLLRSAYSWRQNALLVQVWDPKLGIEYTLL